MPWILSTGISDQPFLVYVPHSMPHVPIFCSDEFEGKSGKGLICGCNAGTGLVGW